MSTTNPIPAPSEKELERAAEHDKHWPPEDYGIVCVDCDRCSTCHEGDECPESAVHALKLGWRNFGDFTYPSWTCPDCIAKDPISKVMRDLWANDIPIFHVHRSQSIETDDHGIELDYGLHVQIPAPEKAPFLWLDPEDGPPQFYGETPDLIALIKSELARLRGTY